MAQDPWAAFNPQPAPAAPTSGPILGAPPKPEKPDAPKTTWSAPETPKEGPLAGAVVQTSSEGKLDVVQPAPKSAVPKTEEARRAAADELARVIDKIDTVAFDAADNNGWFETGFTGGLLRDVKGTAAFDLNEGVKTIQANTAFDRLQKMREESPTGAALGSVTEKELDLLKATVSSINPDQSAEAFFSNLAEAKRVYLTRLRQIDPELAAQYEKKKGIRFEGGDNGRAILVFNDGDVNTDTRQDPFGIGGSADPNNGGGGSDGGPGGGGFWQGIAQGTGSIVEGIGGVAGIVLDPINTTIGRAMGYDNYTANFGRDLREMADLPQIQNPLARAVVQGAAGGLAFGGGAAASAARQAPGLARNALLQLGANPIGDAVVSGASAGSGEAARAAGLGPGGQALASLAGGVAGAGAVSRFGRVPAGSPPRGPVAPSDPREIVVTGKDWNVPVFTSDVAPPTTVGGKSARLLGETIPFAGTGGGMGGRATQQAAREEATARFVQELGGSPASLDDITKDFVQTRGRQLGNLTKAKDSVIDALQDPIKPVQMRETLRTIDTQIAKLNRANAEAFAPVVAKLQSFRDVLASGKTLREVEMNRRLLGDLFEDPNLSSIRGDGQKAINAIYAPLRNDMGNVIETTLGKSARAKWQTANDKLAGLAGELGDNKFKSVLNKADTTPEQVSRLLFSKTPSELRRLYNNLSDAGKIKARAAIIHEAATKAMDGEAISVDRFKQGLKAMDASLGVFFSPADKVRIDGFVRLMDATQRAKTATSEVMTGARNTAFVGGIGLQTVFGSWTIPAAGTIGLMARAYESAPFRDLILKLGKTKPGSQAEAVVGKRISDYLSRAVPQIPANDVETIVTRSATAASAENPEQ